MSGRALAEAEGIIHRFIVDELLASQGRTDEIVTAEMSLFRTGIIDSFGLFSLVLHLEQEFDITVEDEEVVPEHFDSITAIIEFLQMKRSGAVSGAASAL